MIERVDPFALAEAARWRAASEGTPGLEAYVGAEVSFAQAHALLSVVWPEVVEVEGCVVRATRAGSVAAWMTNTGGDVSAVERVVNHLHLWDLFEDGDGELTDTERAAQAVAEAFVARVVADGWRASLAAGFPDRRFVVEESGEADGEYGPTVTFWSVPPGG